MISNLQGKGCTSNDYLQRTGCPAQTGVRARSSAQLVQLSAGGTQLARRCEWSPRVQAGLKRTQIYIQHNAIYISESFNAQSPVLHPSFTPVPYNQGDAFRGTMRFLLLAVVAAAATLALAGGCWHPRSAARANTSPSGLPARVGLMS